MAGDYTSGLETENDIIRAHILLFGETMNTNVVSRQTLHINQAGLVIFPLTSLFSLWFLGCDWMLLVAHFSAFVPCH